MLDQIVRQSGLHMEEVLRRQRRKKQYFYDHMQAKFGSFWNKKVQYLSQQKGGGLKDKKKTFQLYNLNESK